MSKQRVFFSVSLTVKFLFVGTYRTLVLAINGTFRYTMASIIMNRESDWERYKVYPVGPLYFGSKFTSFSFKFDFFNQDIFECSNFLQKHQETEPFYFVPPRFRNYSPCRHPAQQQLLALACVWRCSVLWMNVDSGLFVKYFHDYHQNATKRIKFWSVSLPFDVKVSMSHKGILYSAQSQ